MIHSFTYNGVSSEELGLYVGGQFTFNAPQRDVTKVSIPGRNGDLVRDNGRFLNTQVAYNIVAMRDFAETARKVRTWLNSAVGYARLEDTYDTDHFRMALVASTIDFETSAFNRTGKAQIVFDCKPQRFLKIGEAPKVMRVSDPDGMWICNPTQFESKPLIYIQAPYGSGEIAVGEQIITLTNIPYSVTIDSETMNCYSGNTNLNAKVNLGSGGFPKLPPGDTNFSIIDGIIAGIEVTGRWWEL